MKERPRYQLEPPKHHEKILGEVACFALEHGIRFDIEGRENLAQTKKHLKEGGSLICYFNHRSTIDPGILIEILKEHVGAEIRDWVVPGSYKHLDPKRGTLPPLDSWLMRGFAYKYGEDFELGPVVQFYDLGFYPDKLVRDMNVAFVRRAIRALQSPGGVLLIAPEGTRNQQNNQLLKAQEGIGLFLKRGKNTVAQPIGLIGCGLPRAVFIKPRVVIGQIHSLDKVREVVKEKGVETIEDAMMVLLAQLLPPEYRGVYAQYC